MGSAAVQRHEAQLTNAQSALDFILAGNATFTVVSLRSGVRYTFKVRQSDQKESQPGQQGRPSCWFVNLLTGPENESDYTYMGIVRQDRNFTTTKASKFGRDSAPVQAFGWTLARLVMGILPKDIEIWHSGRCGRCGRTLTVPESIASGFGPECIKLT